MAAETSLFLSKEELAELTDDELDKYVTLLETVEDAWLLSPKQLEAERLSHQVDELLYGGAAGGGKTDWLLWHAYQLSIKHKNHQTVALRRTYPRLRDTLIKRSKEKFDPKVARWVASEKQWVFRDTGSIIQFGNCENEDDVGNYLSSEWDLIVVEEATEFTGEMWMMLRTRNRATARKRARGIHPHTIGATNPGQIGHNFFKDRFVDATDYGRHPIAKQELEVHGRKKEVSVAFVQARVIDNPHIDPDYIFTLAQLPEVQRRQYLDGDWDVFVGQFFTEFSRDRHVCKPFDIPAEWPRIRCIDYGFGNPFCCLWIAFDWDGNAYVYRERYGPGFTASAQAKAIVEGSVQVDDLGRPKAEQFLGTFADPSIWGREGSGLSIAAQYRNEGLICRKALNKRIDGWSRVRDWLQGDGTPDGGSKVTIFDSCVNLIRTMPKMQRDKDRPEDLQTKSEDHACLVAGTLVTTGRGQVPIERVRVGDEALTRAGWRPVVAACQAGWSEPVGTVHLSNGAVLRGTADHPVWTEQGWVDLANLLQNATMLTCLQQSVSLSTESDSVDTRTHRTTPSGPTSRPTGRPANVAWDAFTKRFGRRRTARSPKATTSTTGTKTPSTTLSTTSNVSPDATTFGTTPSRESYPQGLPPAARSRWSEPLSGIAHRKGAPGTLNMAEPLGLGAILSLPAASIAAPSTSRSSRAGSARTSASRPLAVLRGWTTLIVSVLRAARRSVAIGTPAPAAALVSVVKPFVVDGRADVFNLTVDGAHEFFANGVLVSNCDALRYGLTTRAPRAKRPSTPDERQDIDRNLQRVLKERSRGPRHPVMGRL